MKKNTLSYTVRIAAYQFTLLTMGATLLQSYLIERGFSEESTGFCTGWGQASATAPRTL